MAGTNQPEKGQKLSGRKTLQKVFSWRGESLPKSRRPPKQSSEKERKPVKREVGQRGVEGEPSKE